MPPLRNYGPWFCGEHCFVHLGRLSSTLSTCNRVMNGRGRERNRGRQQVPSPCQQGEDFPVTGVAADGAEEGSANGPALRRGLP